MRKHASLWERTTVRKRYPPLESARQADFVIVGAGITGLTTALLLKRAGKRVIVIEADEIGAGTSGATTAHASTLWDPGYDELLKHQGERVATQVAQCLRRGIDQIETFVKELGIACEFERLPGYYYAEKGQPQERIEEQYRAARRAGLEVSQVSSVPLPFPVTSGLRVENQAQFHALAYLEGLAAAIDGDGSSVHTHSRVTSMTDTPCEVQTEHGRVTAEAIVLATHTPLGKNPVQTEIAPYRSYALAARIRGDFPLALFWDAAAPYHYLRRHPVGDEWWLIAGGSDRKTGHGEDWDSRRTLREYVRDRFEIVSIDHEWSAQFFEPSDHVPFIGRSPFAKHTLIATGFSGDGVPFGSCAGILLSDTLIRGAHEFGELFRPDRLPLAGIGSFVKENADVVRSFVGDRMPAKDEEADLARLEPGKGLVTGGAFKMAVYRDEAGNLSCFSAVCPHMKCIVRWNDAESSFDCPCHGSRFSKEGAVLEGPSLSALKPIRP